MAKKYQVYSIYSTKMGSSFGDFQNMITLSQGILKISTNKALCKIVFSTQNGTPSNFQKGPKSSITLLLCLLYFETLG
jgi:hypothetical protein